MLLFVNLLYGCMVVWLYCDLQFDDLQVMFDPSFVWYAWYVARSTVCMPSDLLAVWFQSRYETKLWHVRQLHATGSPRLTASLADLRGRYYDSLRQPFESKLDYMLAKNHDDKFGESLGWELFNQQPVRYLFNTNKCLSVATCAMFASVFKLAKTNSMVYWLVVANLLNSVAHASTYKPVSDRDYEQMA